MKRYTDKQRLNLLMKFNKGFFERNFTSTGWVKPRECFFPWSRKAIDLGISEKQ